MDDRRQRLEQATLYLVCGELGDDFLVAALRGGVDIVQLRIKNSSDERIVAAGQRYRRVCDAHGALLILNDRPDLARAVGADGVHIGQDDGPVQAARAMVGPERLIGLSTHSARQLQAAVSVPVDYVGVGPVHATPTKPGRPAVGVELVRHAARHCPLPFFAIGGITAENLAAVRDAGARRVAVVRALTEAEDPRAAARALKAAVSQERVSVGTA